MDIDTLNAMLAECRFTKPGATVVGFDRGILHRYAAANKVRPLRLPDGTMLWTPKNLAEAKQIHEAEMAAKRQAAEKALEVQQRKLSRLHAKVA